MRAFSEMLARVRRLAALSGADRALLARAWLYLVVVDVALRALGFGRLAGRLAAAPRPPSGQLAPEPTPAQLQRAASYAHWLEVAAAHHVVRARCLHRSLALQLWLRRDAIPSALRIGVRKADGQLKAHAWVEMGADGSVYVIGERPAELAGFARLSQPSGRATPAGLETPDGLRSAWA